MCDAQIDWDSMISKLEANDANHDESNSIKCGKATLFFNESGFCKYAETDGRRYSAKDFSVNWYDDKLLCDGSFITRPKTNLTYPYSWRRGNIEIKGNDGNIYTYPCPSSFNKSRLAFFVNMDTIDEDYNHYYTELHNRTFAWDLVRANSIKIGEKTNSLMTCFHNLDWTKGLFIMANQAFCWNNWSNSYVAYSVIYKDAVPSDVWGQALQSIRSNVFSSDFINDLKNTYQVAVVSKINNSSVNVTHSTTLMGLSFPAMRMSSNSDENTIYCYQTEDIQGSFICYINENRPLYCLKGSDLSIKWIFMPNEGEKIYDFQEDKTGRYVLLFGSTTKHGYIGYENPMIVIVNVNTGKQFRWYYDTPTKGSFSYERWPSIGGPVIAGLTDNVFLIKGRRDKAVNDDEIIDFERFIRAVVKTNDSPRNSTASDFGTDASKNEDKGNTNTMNLPDLDIRSVDVVPYVIITTKPTFSGGSMNDFQKWINANIKYPNECRAKGIEGRATVKFLVDTDGNVRNVTIDRSSGNTMLDEEALRVVRSSPKWTNGQYSNGDPAIVSLTMPVVFVLY